MEPIKAKIIRSIDTSIGDYRWSEVTVSPTQDFTHGYSWGIVESAKDPRLEHLIGKEVMIFIDGDEYTLAEEDLS